MIDDAPHHLLRATPARRLIHRLWPIAALVCALALCLPTGALAKTITETYTFTYPGSPAQFHVPAEVNSLEIEAFGAPGGGELGVGGSGGEAIDTNFTVTAEAYLEIVVGGTGEESIFGGSGGGGFNGGGSAGEGGYGGGGESDVRPGTCAASLSCSASDATLIGGGGGGNSSSHVGGGGGGNPAGGSGGHGSNPEAGGEGGGGGTQSAGGTGGAGGVAGAGGTAPSGKPGEKNKGGAGAHEGCAGGGGGGGYWGGGGGGSAAGGNGCGAGGGGSSTGPSGTTYKNDAWSSISGGEVIVRYTETKAQEETEQKEREEREKEEKEEEEKSTTTTSSPSSSDVAFGVGVYDNATVTGTSTFGAPTGKVYFEVCGPLASATGCSYPNGTEVGSPQALASAGPESATAQSTDFTASKPGIYCFYAEYEGSASYDNSLDESSDECFTVKAKPPSATLTTPAEGASYTLGQTVDASYSCAEGEGSTLSSCDGTVTNGSAINTGSIGEKTFTVTAKDSDGQEVAVTHKYTVTRAATTTTPSGTIAVGSSENDEAVVKGNATGGHPTGTVDFYVCGPSASSCASETDSLGTVTLTELSTSESTAKLTGFTPTEGPGKYCFLAKYEGSVDYLPSSDGESGECFTVTKATPTMESTPSGTIAVGGDETDNATVTGNSVGKNPTGSVKFIACKVGTNPCASAGTQFGGSIALKAGSGSTSTATSADFTPTEGPGTYCIRVEYEGDSNYNTATDDFGDECFTVTKATPTVKSTPSEPGILVGESVTDGVTVDGNAVGGSPTGSVSFSACGPSASPIGCSPAAGKPVGSGPVTLTAAAADKSTAGSSLFTPTSPGTWCFAAVYEGDTNYLGSRDTSSDECFTVTRGPSVTVSTPSSPSSTLAGSEGDLVVVSGNPVGGSPTGTVSFLVCGPLASPAGCPAGTGAPVGTPVELVGAGSDTATATFAGFTASSPGTWCFTATYSGDGNYLGSDDVAPGECFTVPTPAPPSVTIAAPLNGAVLSPEQALDASFSCGDSTGASGIASCIGTVGNGAQIDTSTPGPHSFSVTATSRDGLSTTDTVTYTVSAVKFAVLSIKVVHRRRLKVVVLLPGAGTVAAIATHELGSLAHTSALKPGHGRFAAYGVLEKIVGGPGVVTLELKLSTRGRRLLRLLRHPRLRVTVNFETPAGVLAHIVRTVRY